MPTPLPVPVGGRHQQREYFLPEYGLDGATGMPFSEGDADKVINILAARIYTDMAFDFGGQVRVSGRALADTPIETAGHPLATKRPFRGAMAGGYYRIVW